jgi:signal transduction histidine kinase
MSDIGQRAAKTSKMAVSRHRSVCMPKQVDIRMSSQPYHVLIVEKDPNQRETYERYLRDDPTRQFDVITSDWPERAGAVCQTRMPDCVVLDREVFEKNNLRRLAGPAVGPLGTTTVVLLDKADPATVARLGVQKAGDWLVRDGIDPCRLRQTVGHAIERSRLELEVAARQRALTQKGLEHNEFASIVSHDLSAPARRIDGFCQLLSRRYQGKLDAEADEFLTFLTDESARLLRLIGDLLTYSRLSSRHQAAQPTDSNEVLDAVLADFAEKLREADGQVTRGWLPSVLADRSQLFQLLSHLIDNAIRFRGDRPLLIHVACQQRQNDYLFSVEDNGRGFDPQQRERVFQVFQRLSGSDEQDGTGMGLACCQRIVEIHGGEMWAEPEPGRGTRCCFTLPHASPPAESHE